MSTRQRWPWQSPTCTASGGLLVSMLAALLVLPLVLVQFVSAVHPPPSAGLGLPVLVPVHL